MERPRESIGARMIHVKSAPCSTRSHPITNSGERFHQLCGA